MLIEIQYENTRQTIEVNDEEVKGWVNINIDEEDDEDVIQEKVQEAINEEYNRPEYNIWHRETRHLFNLFSNNMEKDKNATYGEDNNENDDVNSDEALYKHTDKRIFNKYENEYHQEQSYIDCCNLIRQYLKPELAEIFITIALDGFKAKDIAEKTGGNANNISKKYNRAKKKLQEVLDKNVLL